MMPYFEKALCSVAQEISIFYFFIFFQQLFSVHVYRVCLILLLFLLLLLLNIIVFSNFLVKTKNLHKNHRSSSVALL